MSLVLLLFAIICVPELVSAENKTNKLLVLLIDGFRWDYFDMFDHKQLPGFTRLRETGVSAEAFIPSFPSLSYVNYYSIMTGLHPESHGMLDNYMWDPVYKTEFLIGNNPDQYHSYWWNDGEPLWITAQKQGKRSYFWYWCGCEVEIRGYRPTFCDSYQSNPYPNLAKFALGVDRAVEVLNNGSADLAGVYFGTVDSYGHKYGPNSDEVKDLILSLDEVLVRLLDAIESSSDINMMLFSDHGMSERVGGLSDSSTQIINVVHYISGADWTRAVGGMTAPVLQIWPKADKEDLIYEQLRTAHPNLTVYKKEDIPERYHLKNHYRVPPIYLVADEGYIIVRNPWTRWVSRIGHHGYDGEVYPNMHGIFMVVGPDFKQNFTFQIGQLPVVEVYQLMCHVMNITASPNNGSWFNVCDALADDNACSTGHCLASNLCLWMIMAAIIGILESLQ